jgi:hypothetical protein
VEKLSGQNASMKMYVVNGNAIETMNARKEHPMSKPTTSSREDARREARKMRKKGDLNRKSTHKMYSNMGMKKKEETDNG